jgi:heptosyltransferase-2/heptosyltransferase-3
MTPSLPLKRIALIQPCCIGDVVLATAALAALRRAYPDAHITWIVGSWSRQAVEGHPLLDAVVDCGAGALPINGPASLLRFVQLLRAGRFDALVSLVRSPRMSAAARLSGVPIRAGIDSGGRGFGYTHKLRIDPSMPRHEAALYLDVVGLLGADGAGSFANVPVQASALAGLRLKLDAAGVRSPLLVVNPAGCSNPGMTMNAKRYPPAQMAALADRLLADLKAALVLVAGPDDGPILDAVQARLTHRADAVFAGSLSFAELAALAAQSTLYVGNDTGLTHLAAAAGGRTVMIFGPSDPVRYKPFTLRSAALWKPAAVSATGVSGGAPVDWDWSRDGISVDDAHLQIMTFLNATP